LDPRHEVGLKVERGFEVLLDELLQWFWGLILWRVRGYLFHDLLAVGLE
jgi:hypothetical protein